MNGFSVARDIMGLSSRPRGKRQDGGPGRRAARPLHLRSLQLESLEDRTLLNGTAIYDHTTPILIPNGDLLARNSHLRGVSIVSGRNGIVPALSHSTPPYDPTQIDTAYGINSIPGYASGQGNGSGETIAIVDAYKDPNIASELAYFDTSFGLPAASLTIMNQSGGSSLSRVSYNSGWAGEIALDVEWVHAIAPGHKSCSWRLTTTRTAI